MIKPEKNKYYIKSSRTGEPAFRKCFETYGTANAFLKKQILKEYFEIDFNTNDSRLKKIILEGLGHGDLSDLVKPLISFDEYVSKNDNNNIVLGFFILNEPLAVEPLARFCNKIPGIVDVDSSDSDLITNASIVYVEFKREKESKEHIKGLISDISKVSDIPLDDFAVSFPSQSEKFQYSEDLVDLYFTRMV